ncbi:MAG: ABC transporter ATP-binding protein [Coxiella sp. RIFCSPHIGHO2_12_FULL_44_14]|nr:MAG: ABC transporter ATP-binding protein [Coxiella sp. RIFCSPHIGHO2_12_FULL_44_14]
MATYLEVERLTVDIPIYHTSRSFRSVLANRLGGKINRQKTGQVSIRALDNISFRVEHGDRLGLIGHNGAGKTTLLRLLAGVYKPLQGIYRFQGKITPLFNISIGLDLDDTGIDNIFTIGTYLGMPKTEIRHKKNEIIEFSELGDFIRLPVRTYSTGMMTRLSFAIATAINPDILLMDEGIGAGDASFAEKAQKRLESFYSRMNILVIASHAEELIRRLCTKAILLEHGKMIACGAVEYVLELYRTRPAG